MRFKYKMLLCERYYEERCDVKNRSISKHRWYKICFTVIVFPYIIGIPTHKFWYINMVSCKDHSWFYNITKVIVCHVRCIGTLQHLSIFIPQLKSWALYYIGDSLLFLYWGKIMNNCRNWVELWGDFL